MDPGSSTPGGFRGSPRTAAGIQDALALAEAEEQPPEPEPSATIEIVVADTAWRRFVPGAETLARRAVLAALADDGAADEGSISVLLADDRTLRRLNGEHRGIEKPTNVLSFPGEAPGHLGDIALALGVVRREAAAAGKRPAAHFAHLVAHGTLHLLGHDHLAAGEARRMERAEARAMARLRLPNPWKGLGA